MPLALKSPSLPMSLAFLHLETNTTNNGNDDSQAGTAAVVTANATRYQLQSGSITFTDLISLIPPTSHAPSSQLAVLISDALSTALQSYKSAFIISGAGVGSAAHSGTINWGVSIDNALTQYLAADQSVDVTYRITVTDDSNITAGDEINVDQKMSSSPSTVPTTTPFSLLAPSITPTPRRSPRPTLLSQHPALSLPLTLIWPIQPPSPTSPSAEATPQTV